MDQKIFTSFPSRSEAPAPMNLLHINYFLPLFDLPKTRDNLQRNKYVTLNTQYKKWAKQIIKIHKKEIHKRCMLLAI